MRLALAAFALASTTLLACAGAPPPRPVAPPPAPPPAELAPAPPPTPPSPPADPFAIPRDLREEPAATMTPVAASLILQPYPVAPAGMPKPPPACAAFVKRAALGKAPVCKERPAALDALDAALAEIDEATRDAKLVALEGCAGLPVGIVRALRADLAPAQCGDALTEALVDKPPKALTSTIYNTLLGQALAGRMARLGYDAPKVSAPYDKAHLLEHMNGPFKAWLVLHAQAIQATSDVAAKLTFYGRAIAAVETGMAEMRMADAARAVPLPADFAKDDELRTVYYAALDEALEPRKARGRDATLVGLADFASVGALRDPRVDRARQLLAKLYGGRRIDALDPLLFPALTPAVTATAATRLATKLPAFYSGVLLDAERADDPALVRALLERGVPAQFRKAAKTKDLAAPARFLHARARLMSLDRYWRAFDADEAIALSAGPPGAKRSDEETFLLALALALHGGPANASDMMHRAPIEKLGIGQVGALEMIASAGGPFAGLALYDAALVREVSAPPEADAAYWRDVETRYRSSLDKLETPGQRAQAEAGARHAAEIAAALTPSR